MFSATTSERLGWYVYQLIHTGNGRPFYVGKGTGDRVFAHINDAQKSKGHGGDRKLNVIRELACRPQVRVVAHGLDEPTALLLEAVLIKQLDLGVLTNKCHGHHATNLFLTPEDLEAVHGPREVKAEQLKERVLLVSLNGGPTLPAYPKFQHDPQVVAQRTLGNWRVSASKAPDVDVVAGVYRGVVRTVFSVKKRNGCAVFEVIHERDKRLIKFAGQPEEHHELQLARVTDAAGNVLSSFPPKGSRRYVGAWPR